MHKYYTCKDVAAMTGTKIKTVWNWCNSGILKANRPGGRDYRIKDTDFEEFMASNRKVSDMDSGKEQEK